MTIVGKKDGIFKVYDLSFESSYDELKQHFDEYFEVDSRIATILIILNSKGYFTEMSCDEHFHDSIEFDVFSYSDIPSETILKYKTDAGVACHYINKKSVEKSFIRFKSTYGFPCLPKEWEIEDGVYLFYKYESSLSEYDFYLEQAKALKDLHDWAISLPDN